MKVYQYYEYQPDSDKKEILVEITEDEILESYWNYWNEKMVKKFGYGHELITKENCIEDFIVIHWAWEKTD